jgi:hypothetical protein
MTVTEANVNTPDTLIVSWHWPPTHRASTHVLANLFAGAPRDGFRVVTRRMPAPPPADATPVPPLETFHVPWPRLEPDGALSLAWTSLRTVGRMVQRARHLYAARPFQRVLAVYPHRFGLLAGDWIARAVGVPLVVYLHDLFAEAYLTQSAIKRAFWRRVDQRVLAGAALVVVPTDEFAAHYRARGIAQTLVVPHCVPATAAPQPVVPHAGPLHLVYAGNVYEAHADAMRAFLEATDGVGDLRLSLLTPAQVPTGGHPTRWASRLETQQIIQNADAGVVVLGQNTPYPAEVHGCFPSKIVDYLAAGRPILAVVPAGCFADRFVRENGVGIAVNTLNPADIGAAIHRLRDAAFRERLAVAARQTTERLQAAAHLPRLLRGLAQVGTATPAASRLPACPVREPTPLEGGFEVADDDVRSEACVVIGQSR